MEHITHEPTTPGPTPVSERAAAGVDGPAALRAAWEGEAAEDYPATFLLLAALEELAADLPPGALEGPVLDARVLVRLSLGRVQGREITSSAAVCLPAAHAALLADALRRHRLAAEISIEPWELVR